MDLVYNFNNYKLLSRHKPEESILYIIEYMIMIAPTCLVRQSVDSLNAIKFENAAHVFWQRGRIRPHKVISDRNNVLLPIQGSDNLLWIT